MEGTLMSTCEHKSKFAVFLYVLKFHLSGQLSTILKSSTSH